MAENESVANAIIELKTHILYIKEKVNTIDARHYDDIKDKGKMAKEISYIRASSMLNRRLIFGILGLIGTLFLWMLGGNG